MTVRIPVSADAAAVLRAFGDIQAAIRRAGQEGRDFAKLDLGHPELKDFAADIQAVHKSLEDLKNIGRGATASAVRQVYDGSTRFLDIQASLGRRYPDPNDLNRAVANTGRYVLGGTSFALPPHPPPALPPGAGGGAGAGYGGGAPAGGAGGGGIPLPGIGGLASGGMGALRGAGLAMLGVAGIQRAGALVGQAIGQAQDESMSTDRLMRSLRDLNVDFDGLRGNVRAATAGLALTYQEGQRLSASWVKLTNETDAGKMSQAVRFAAGFARGYGIDPGAAVNAFGRAQFAGEDPRRLAAIVAETVQQGRMTGRVEETMEAIVRWTETSARLLSTGTGAGGYAATLAALNASGIPGLRGENGVALLNQMNGAVIQGGAAGEASQFLTYRALARYGVTDPYRIEHMVGGGMLEPIGDSGATVGEAMFGEIDRIYAGRDPYQRYSAIGRHFGITSRQAEALDRVRRGGGGFLSLRNTMANAGVDPRNMNPGAYGDIAEVSAEGADLEAWRRTVLGRNNIPVELRRQIQGAQGEDLRSLLIRGLAEGGRTETEGSRVAQSIADLNNSLTSAGTGLIPVITDMRNGMTLLTDGVGKLTGALGDLYEYMVHGQRRASDSIGAPTLSSGPAGHRGALGGGPGGDMGSFLGALEAAESGNGTAMANPRSSARGWHQFTRDTWLQTVRRYGPEWARNLPEDQQLELRNDRAFSRQMAEQHLRNDILPGMQARGVSSTPLAGYAGWHFGAAGGAALMNAPDDAALETLFPAEVIAANPYMRGMTAGQWRQRFGRRFQSSPAAGGEGQAGTQPQSFNIQPLRVIHERQNGEQMGVDFLPVIPVGDPMAYGVG